MSPIQWRRGFDRLYIVLAICWVVWILVVEPLRQRKEMIEIYAEQMSDCSLRAFVAHTDEKACGEEYKQKVDKLGVWGFFSKDLLWIAVIPPVILYLLLRGVGFVAVWVGRGFKQP